MKILTALTNATYRPADHRTLRRSQPDVNGECRTQAWWSFSRSVLPRSQRQRIAILCGRGNNGGDGLVVARMLREQGLRPRVLLFADPAKVSGDAAVNLGRLADSGMPEVIESPEAWQAIKASLQGTTLLVDALLGTGLTKPLGGLLLRSGPRSQRGIGRRAGGGGGSAFRHLSRLR